MKRILQVWIMVLLATAAVCPGDPTTNSYKDAGYRDITGTDADSLQLWFIPRSELFSTDSKKSLFEGAAGLHIVASDQSGGSVMGTAEITMRVMDYRGKSEPVDPDTVVADYPVAAGRFRAFDIGASFPVVGYKIYIRRLTGTGTVRFFVYAIIQ